MPLLTIIIFLPAVLGLLSAAMLPAKQMKYGALVAMLANLAIVLFAATQFDWSGSFTTNATVFGSTFDTSFQFREHVPWLDAFRISYTVGVDNLSMIMVVLTAVLGIFGVLCSWEAIEKREKEFYVFLLALQTGIYGTFLALDMFVFYCFWELMLVPLYFLVGIWGSKNRLYATMKFFLFTLFGSVLMLVALIWMYYNNGFYNTATNQFELIKTYSYEVMLQTQLGQGANASFHASYWPFLALFLAFAIKVPLFPLHTWLPDAHTEAPTAGSVILAGILLKTGGYAMMRFCVPLFPEAAVIFAPLITWLSVIAIVYGAMTAIVQTDIKRLVAYSSVSHMGFVTLGIFSLNPQGMTGAVLQMINHGISTSGLFLAVGMIYERTHTRQLSDFGGLANNMPVLATLTMAMVLSSVGLPGLNGFLGEFHVLLGSMHNLPILMQGQQYGTFASNWGMSQFTWVPAAIATTGVIFGAVYLLIMYQRTFFGKLDEEKNGLHADLEPREWGQLGFLAVAALVIGLFPMPLLKAIAPATRTALQPVANSLATRVVPTLPMDAQAMIVAPEKDDRTALAE